MRSRTKRGKEVALACSSRDPDTERACCGRWTVFSCTRKLSGEGVSISATTFFSRADWGVWEKVEEVSGEHR